MKTAPDITFRHLPYSSPLAALVEARTEKLEARHPRIDACSVLIERPREDDPHLHVRVVVAVPGAALVADSTGVESAPAVVSRTFSALRHRLERREAQGLERRRRSRQQGRSAT